MINRKGKGEGIEKKKPVFSLDTYTTYFLFVLRMHRYKGEKTQ